MNQTTYDKIQKWRKRYEKLPNGWPVCAMIGDNYKVLEPKKSKRREILRGYYV